MEGSSYSHKVLVIYVDMIHTSASIHYFFVLGFIPLLMYSCYRIYPKLIHTKFVLHFLSPSILKFLGFDCDYRYQFDRIWSPCENFKCQSHTKWRQKRHFPSAWWIFFFVSCHVFLSGFYHYICLVHWDLMLCSGYKFPYCTF